MNDNLQANGIEDYITEGFNVSKALRENKSKIKKIKKSFYKKNMFFINTMIFFIIFIIVCTYLTR